MSTQKEVEIPSTETKGTETPVAKKKSSSLKKKRLAKKNLDSTKKTAKKEETKKAPSVVDRVLMYVYPKNVKTSDEKKTFRRQARATFRKLDKQIDALESMDSRTKDQRIQLKELKAERLAQENLLHNPAYSK